MIVSVPPQAVSGTIGSSTVVLLCALFGNTLAIVVGGWFTQRNAKRAEDNATKAQLATSKARLDAYSAQEAASQAAMALVESAKATNQQLNSIAKTGEATHQIVNNQRTVMLRAIAVLSRTVADARPTDSRAAQAADDAEHDLKNNEMVNADPQTKP